MNNINDFIKTLSIKDKKTLSQKGLKLVEEVGELARVILPYDSAHGTNHRFTDREAILEEVVDVYLTNISIAHSLGFTDEEFNDMLAKKSEKWSQLQSSEEKAEFPLPFEIHISVDASKTFNHTLFNGDEKDILYLDYFDIDHFKNACSLIEVKPIVIDLEINSGSIIKDIMTSSKHFGDNRTAYEESKRICRELALHGYKVVRNKIESVPWHPAAPVMSTGKEIPNGCYFESHIGVTIYTDQKDELNDFVKSTLTDGSLIELSGTAKLSQNFFKKSKDGSKFVNMLTYRSNMCGSPKFKLEVEGIKHLLQEEGFEFEKVEVEYAVYDTNVTHDAKWILGYEVA
jgi:NTP pyrophosphatase (non-canonical NTP hydrolase)